MKRRPVVIKSQEIGSFSLQAYQASHSNGHHLIHVNSSGPGFGYYGVGQICIGRAIREFHEVKERIESMA